MSRASSPTTTRATSSTRTTSTPRPQQVFANFEKVLAHYGATRNQVVSETQYIVDLPKYNNAMAAANLAYFGDHRPTSSTIGVASLFFPGQLIETNFILDTRLPA